MSPCRPEASTKRLDSLIKDFPLAFQVVIYPITIAQLAQMPSKMDKLTNILGNQLKEVQSNCHQDFK